MILNRKQIEQLAELAGFKTEDIAGSSLDESFQIYNGSLTNPENNEVISGIVVEHFDYPEDLADILEP